MKQRAACTLAALAIATSMAAPAAWAAQSDAAAPKKAPNAIDMINDYAAKADIQTTPMRDGLAMLSGSGGNIIVLTKPQGKLMVDAGINVSRVKLEAAVKALGPEPIKYLINTHWHWDHTDGNVWVAKTGPVIIIAHPKALPDVSRTNVVNFWPYTFAPLAKEARPTQFVDKQRVIKFGDETVTIKALGSGHTSSDLWVHFKKANALATGDIFWNGIYPFIDNEHGGSIDTNIAWASKAIDATDKDTMIVPGHGPLATRAELIDFRDMLVAIRDAVATMKKQGKSLEEIVAAKPTAPYDARYGKNLIGPDIFTKLVYDGLKK